MKALFVTILDRGLRVGGARNKIEHTRETLEKKGVTVIPYSPWEDRLRGVDICHVFQAHASLHPYCVAAKNRSIPLVISPILNDPRFPSWALWLASNWATKIPGVCVAHRLVAEMLRLADALLPLSPEEARFTLRAIGGLDPARLHIVPNGVESRFASGRPELFVEKYGFAPDVLFVGRVDRNKNLLGLIEALRGTGLRLAVVGSAESVEVEYFEECRRAGAGIATFIGRLDHRGELLPAAYAASAVFVLPSFSEVFPNTILEAGTAGCQVVVTRNCALRPALGDRVTYVSPSDTKSIRKAVLAAHSRPRSAELSMQICQGSHGKL